MGVALGRGDGPAEPAAPKRTWQGDDEMNSAMKTVAAAMLAAVGVVGCGGIEGEEGAEEVTMVTSPLTFEQCRTKVQNRAADPTVQAIVGTQVGSILNLGTGARGNYTNNASIFCKNSNGVTKIVLGLIRAKYDGVGAQASFLGYPTTDELTTLFNTGRYNFFEFGAILWKFNAAQAFEVHGQIRGLYQQLGSEWGEMGFPQGDEVGLSGNRRRNIFEFGRLYYNTVSQQTWPVMTGPGNLSDQLDGQNMPRFTSVNIVPQGLGGDGCITVAGENFTAGNSVQLSVTSPDGVTEGLGV